MASPALSERGSGQRAQRWLLSRHDAGSTKHKASKCRNSSSTQQLLQCQQHQSTTSGGSTLQQQQQHHHHQQWQQEARSQ